MFFAPSKSRYRAKIWNMGVPKTNDHIQIKIKIPDPSQEPPACTYTINLEREIQNMDASKTSARIQINIKILNLSQKPPASYKAPNKTYRTWGFFAPSKSRQRAKILSKSVSKTSDHIKIKIKGKNPSQEIPASFKALNWDYNYIDALCTFISRQEAKISIMGV